MLGDAMEVLDERVLPAGAPHWYVMLFAVSPAAQGHGHGARLLRWIGRCADHAGVPVLLDTTGARNQRFYEGSGFQLAGSDELVDDASEPPRLEYLAMLRPAMADCSKL